MSVETPKNNKKTSLFSLALLALLVTTLGFILSLGISLFAIHPVINDQHQQTLDQQQADQAASLINLQLQQTRFTLQHFAKQPKVINALLSEDSQSLSEVARETEKALPYIKQVRLITKGSAKPDNSGLVPLTYAGIDLINRTQAGSEVQPEAFSLHGSWIINFSQPIIDVKNKNILGVLFASFELELLENSLAALPQKSGRFEVLQEFPSTLGEKPRLSIFTRGESNSDRSLTSIIDGSWLIQFNPARTVNLLTPFSALLPWLIALLIAVSTQGILAWFQAKLLSKNQHALETFIGRLMSENIKRYPRFSLQVFEDIARKVDDNNRPKTEQVHKKTTQPFVKTTQSRTDFIADQSKRQDVLDIQVIEDEQNNQATLEVPQSIFRAYDIRGIVGETLTEDGVRYIGQALGSEILDRGHNEIQVAADGRLSSPMLKKALIEGITSTGCNVLDLGSVPTPVMYFGTHYLESHNGVVITGSHNPKNYNGLKIVIDGVTLAQESIFHLYQRLQNKELHQGEGTISKTSIVSDYLQHIIDDIAIAKPMKVVIDCGNGITGKTAPQLFQGLGCDVVELYSTVDGNFPNHHPDPAKEENMQDLINKVAEVNADIGVAFDGDGDRIGVVTNKGKIISPDRLLMLFALDVVSRNPGCDVIYDIKSTRRLNHLISSAGGCPIMWKTGHSLMKAKMSETGALLGGELSGHIYFKERWFGFDDGAYAAARLIELLSFELDDADTLFERLPEDVSTPELTIDVTDETKFDIIKQLTQSANFENSTISTIDGIRVDFSHGWGLVRASNTTPKLTLRFEAQDEISLAEIKDNFKKELLAIDDSLSFPA